MDLETGGAARTGHARMKITLNGYYGFSNYGDDLFNLTSVLGAARWWQGHEVDILGPLVKGINAPFRVPPWFPKALYTAPGLGGKLSRLAFLSAALTSRDMLVYAGGSTLSHGSLLKRLQRVAAEREWTRFSAIGVSVGPFSDAADEAEAARFLRRFSFVSVRDQQSVAFLERMHVPYKPVMARDLVGALPLLLPVASAASQVPGARRTLGISLRLFECHSGGNTVKEDLRNAALMEGISRFAHREDVMVRIFCLNTHPRWGDMAVSRRLLDQVVKLGAVAEMVSCEDPLLGNWHGLAACTAVLCVRMHAGITAYLTGVPFALVEYHEKCTDYLDDIGQPRELRLGGNLDDPEQVVAILDRLFHNAPRPALPAYTYAREAAANFTAAPWAVTLPEPAMVPGVTNANAPG